MTTQAGSRVLGRLESLLRYLCVDLTGTLGALGAPGWAAVAELRRVYPPLPWGADEVVVLDADQAMLDLHLLEFCLTSGGASEDALDAHHQLEVVLSILARGWNRAPWEATASGRVGCAGEEVCA